MVWVFGGGLIYLVLIVTLGTLTVRNGHWVLFVLGIFLPLLWVIGAVMRPPAPVYAGRSNRPR
jgi:hypothetical protein